MSGQGGWLNPDSSDLFASFVKLIVPALADLVDTWCTINEPNVYAAQSYFSGGWPPGQESMSDYFLVLKHMLIAHAEAYRTIKDFQPHAEVGLAKHILVFQPRSSSPLDRWVTSTLDRAFNTSTLDALQTGEYQPVVGSNEALDTANTLDWIGLNYYQRYHARFALKNLASLGIDYGVPPGLPGGPSGWGELYPRGLYESIKRLWKQFELPINITENGVPDEYDNKRPGWIIESLRHLWHAINFGLHVRGYYFWSLIDNFEWAEGYDPCFRFGLYEVDFETQERTLRDSGKLYAEIARTNTISSSMAEQYAPDVAERLFPGSGPEDLQRVRS
jgi:beta-glucosidase